MSRASTVVAVLLGYFAGSLLFAVAWGTFCAARDGDFPGLVPATPAWWRRIARRLAGEAVLGGRQSDTRGRTEASEAGRLRVVLGRGEGS